MERNLTRALKSAPLVGALFLLCGAYTPPAQIIVPPGVTPMFYADQTYGTDSVTCGRGQSLAACKTIQQAYNNACTNYVYPSGGGPIIQLASGQTFTAGLLINPGTVICTGTQYVRLDLNGATISVNNNSDIYVRNVPVWLRIYSSSYNGSTGAGTLTVTGTKGSLIDSRGGGNTIELEGGINFGPNPTAQFQILSTRFSYIFTCPPGTGGNCNDAWNSVTPQYNVVGGGGSFIEADLGGTVQWEGVTTNISSGLTFYTYFAEATAGGLVTFNAAPIVGANITGPQYSVSKGATISVNAQGTPTNPGNYSLPGNTYLPGSTAGAYGFSGGNFSDPGTPILTGTNLGTGYKIAGTDSAYSIVLGSGVANVNNTVYTVTATQVTNTNFGACTVSPNSSIIGNLMTAQYTGPVSAATNGYETITWVGNGSAISSGSTWWVTCVAPQ